MAYPDSVLKKKYASLYGEEDPEADPEAVGINPDYATGRTSAPIAPGMADGQPKMDQQTALYQYLMQRKGENDARHSPQVAIDKAEKDQLDRERMAFNTFLPAVEKAGANVGTVGGVTPKTVLEKPAQQWIDFYNQQDKNDRADKGLELNETGMNDRLVEYLTGQERMKDEAQKGRDQAVNLNTSNHTFQTDRDKALNDYLTKRRQADIDAGIDKQAGEQQWRSGENALDRDNRVKIAGISGQNAVNAVNARNEKSPGGKLGSSGGKPLTSTAAASMGSYKAAFKQIDELEQMYNSLAAEKGSGIKSMMKGSAPYNYNVARKTYAQGIGTILEKGKLTDADYERKYIPMMPDPWDSNETARVKLNTLRSTTKAKMEGELSGYKEGGFNVSGYGGVSGSETGNRATSQIDSKSKSRLMLDTMAKNPAALSNTQARKYILDNAPELKQELDELIKKSGGR